MVWLAIFGGVALAVAVLGGMALTRTGPPPVVEAAPLLFFANAALSLVAVVIGFGVQRRVPGRLDAAGTEAEAVQVVRREGVRSLAALELSALVAAGTAFLTGEAINLAFVVPFFGFGALFFPTAARLRTWQRSTLGG